MVRYECRDGSQRMWISPIVRPKTGGVALGDALEMGSGSIDDAIQIRNVLGNVLSQQGSAV